MYFTAGGHRVLNEPEWKLFTAAATWLIDNLADSEDGEIVTGTNYFDDLTDNGQKTYLILMVTKALKDPAFVLDPQSAYHDATVSAVIDFAATMTDSDHEEYGSDKVAESNSDVRKLVQDVYFLNHPGKVGKHAMGSNGIIIRPKRWWREQLSRIKFDNFLGDDDYNLDLDETEDSGRPIGAMMGIDPRYFIWVPPTIGKAQKNGCRMDFHNYVGNI